MKNKLKFIGIIVLAAWVMLGLTACDLFGEEDDDRVAVSSVALDKTSASVAVGGKVTLTATISPSNATDKNLKWTSSNTAIATVSTSGEVTGVAPGVAVIVVSTADGGRTAICTVTVSPAPSQAVRPNGNGGVSVDADGNLKIDAELWIFDNSESSPEFKKVDSSFNRLVRASVGDHSWDFSDGIKEGRLNILINSSQITSTDLKTASQEFGLTADDYNIEGSNIRLGGLVLQMRETVEGQDRDYELGLIGNPEPIQGSQVVESFGFIYSMGDISIEGTSTNEGSETHMDFRFASGWNSIGNTMTLTATPLHLTNNASSRNPPATGTRWVLAGYTDDDE